MLTDAGIRVIIAKRAARDFVSAADLPKLGPVSRLEAPP